VAKGLAESLDQGHYGILTFPLNPLSPLGSLRASEAMEKC